MVKSIIITLSLFIATNAFSQNLFFQFRNNRAHTIKKEAVNNAQKMGDIIPYYPTDWFSTYKSVELTYIKDGKSTTLTGKNEILTAEQKNILSHADIGDDIIINIKYLSKNSITDKEESSTMHYETVIVPQTEAEFETTGITNAQHDKKDGRTAQYVKSNIISKIPEAVQKQLKQTLIRFTVNEAGQVNSAKILKSSGDQSIDKLMLEAISNMPAWKPAQNANGANVKQQFEFSIGSEGGC